ncbi:MAG: hypothetical protein Kow0010_12540 [Dehalococcoidia bacterium]
MRHGQTAYNRDGIGLGRADVPLTEEGLRQADRIAEVLAGAEVGRVLTSPLSRARDVATRIAARTGAPLETRHELIELDIGDTEGLTFAAMRERFPEFMAAWRGAGAADAVMPGGESLADVDRRLGSLLEELQVENGEGSVVMVSHNFVLRLLACRLVGLGPERFRSFVFGLGSISEARYEQGEWAIHRLNETCHLRALEP